MSRGGNHRGLPEPPLIKVQSVAVAERALAAHMLVRPHYNDQEARRVWALQKDSLQTALDLARSAVAQRWRDVPVPVPAPPRASRRVPLEVRLAEVQQLEALVTNGEATARDRDRLAYLRHLLKGQTA